MKLNPFATQVINLVKPIASVKKLVVTQQIAADVPELVTGDDKRLMQTALNVVGNAVKFTKEGSISMTVCLERPELERDPNTPDFQPVNTTEYIYIRVQVRCYLLSVVTSDLLGCCLGLAVTMCLCPSASHMRVQIRVCAS